MSVAIYVQFQSAPAPKDGRYYMHIDLVYRKTCFNPRPPLRTGDTMDARRTFSHGSSFNPRPPLRTGDT